MPAKTSLLSTCRQTVEDAHHFVEQQLWDLDLAALPRLKKMLVSVVRIIVIVCKGFAGDKCMLQASALTYITLMSMVPVLALSFALSKGLGAQERIMDMVGAWTAELPPRMAALIEQVFAYVENTNFSVLGATGTVMLLWTVIKVMGKIEHSFNQIWGVQQGRTFARKFGDYLSVLLVVPLLILAGSSVMAFFSSAVLVEKLQAHLGPVYRLYELGLSLGGWFMLFLAFSFLYAFMPNIKVRLFPALAAGVVGGGCWYILQWIYLEGQVGLTKYNAIYGTFAVMPLFLMWLYMSWVVVLFGAELCFALQNHYSYGMERVSADSSFASRELLAFLIVKEVAQAFVRGQTVWSAENYAKAKGISVRMVREVLHVLLEHRVLLAVGSPLEEAYAPGKDLRSLTLHDVAEAFRGRQDFAIKKMAQRDAENLRRILSQNQETSRQCLSQTTYWDVITKQAPELEPATPGETA